MTLETVSAHLVTATDAPDASRLVPRVLLITAHRWLSTTRLARELSDAGFAVEALCPGGHSLTRVEFVSITYRYSALKPTRCLRDTILVSKPDLIIPCDDYTAAQLHKLYASTNGIDASSEKLRYLIARSLGDPKQYPIFYARNQIASLARAAGVPCPTVSVIRNEDELLSLLDNIGFPAVLKTDGSSGGMGVAILRSQADAKRAFRKFAAPPSALRAVKRLIIDGDFNLILPFLRHDRAAVSAQRFIYGRPANAAVACWEGNVLAHVCVEVLASNGETGPATVVRVIEHSGMSQAVERMVSRLKLSGLCGFDFILDSRDGSAHLIDFNPRATQTCHFVSLDRKQPIASLAAKLRGSPVVDGGLNPHQCPIVLFPHSFTSDSKNFYLQHAPSDLPQNAPEFVKLGQDFNRQEHQFLAKFIRRLREKWF